MPYNPHKGETHSVVRRPAARRTVWTVWRPTVTARVTAASTPRLGTRRSSSALNIKVNIKLNRNVGLGSS